MKLEKLFTLSVILMPVMATVTLVMIVATYGKISDMQNAIQALEDRVEVSSCTVNADSEWFGFKKSETMECSNGR